MAHAEALLLVDHEEPQVEEAHVLLQEPVRADHHIDLAAGEPGEDLALFGRRAETVERADLDGEVAHAFGERAEVLLHE